MAAILNGVLDLIGKTPLVKLEKYASFIGAKANIYAKVEFFNPAGSVKDRVALSMIKKAESEGKIKTCVSVCSFECCNESFCCRLRCAVCKGR